MSSLTDDTLDRYRMSAQCHKESVNGEDTIEGEGSWRRNLSPHWWSCCCLTLLTLELILDVPKDFRKSVAVLERSNECLLVKMAHVTVNLFDKIFLTVGHILHHHLDDFPSGL